MCVLFVFHEQSLPPRLLRSTSPTQLPTPTPRLTRKRNCCKHKHKSYSSIQRLIPVTRDQGSPDPLQGTLGWIVAGRRHVGDRSRAKSSEPGAGIRVTARCCCIASCTGSASLAGWRGTTISSSSCCTSTTTRTSRCCRCSTSSSISNDHEDLGHLSGRYTDRHTTSSFSGRNENRPWYRWTR